MQRVHVWMQCVFSQQGGSKSLDFYGTIISKTRWNNINLIITIQHDYHEHTSAIQQQQGSENYCLLYFGVGKLGTNFKLTFSHVHITSCFDRHSWYQQCTTFMLAIITIAIISITIMSIQQNFYGSSTLKSGKQREKKKIIDYYYNLFFLLLFSQCYQSHISSNSI